MKSNIVPFEAEPRGARLERVYRSDDQASVLRARLERTQRALVEERCETDRLVERVEDLEVALSRRRGMWDLVGHAPFGAAVGAVLVLATGGLAAQYTHDWSDAAAVAYGVGSLVVCLGLTAASAGRRT